MSSWLARDAYSPLLVLAAGLLTYLGALGVGRALLRIMRVNLQSPWNTVTEVLLGVQTFSVVVLILGAASIASYGALITVLLACWTVGLIEFARALRTRAIAWARPRGEPPIFWIALALVVMTLAVNLVIAVAPSTKIDELHYHMLAPSRLVHDHALLFYLFPWGAALPHMGFQITAAPLHALGVPDAMNVVSWALSATIVWFIYRVIRAAEHTRVWAATWCAVLTAGLYGAVYWVTGGPTAMGDLAVAALVVAVMIPQSLRPEMSTGAYTLMLGVLASAAAMSKLSSIPMAVALFGAGMTHVVREGSVREATMRCATGLLPIAVLWAPMILWTWYASGAPFGPFVSWWFPNSVYAGLPVRELVERFEPLSASVYLVRQSPLLWAAALCAFSVATLSRRLRTFAALLLLVEIALIAALLVDTRYLSGFPYGLAIVFAFAAPAWALRRWNAPAVRWLALAVFVVPWAAVSLYYARPFARVVFGLESPDQFREKYVSYYADYQALDTMLPPNAVLLTDGQTSASYAPRLPVWSVRDIPPNAAVYQFAESCEPLDSALIGLDTAYYSPSAKRNVFRTPGRAPELAPLCVRRIVRRVPR